MVSVLRMDYQSLFYPTCRRILALLSVRFMLNGGSPGRSLRLCTTVAFPANSVSGAPKEILGEAFTSVPTLYVIKVM